MSRSRIAFLLAALLLVTQIRAEEPKVAQNILFKPTFLLPDTSWSAGTAFLLRMKERPETLFVTAHHLFGPAAGLKVQMSADDIANDVCGAVGLSMQDMKFVVVTKTYLKIAGARSLDNDGADKDLAVFSVESGEKLPAFELAQQMPRVGDTVYVFARLRTEGKPRLLRATVGERTGKQLAYDYAEKGLELGGTSGAPVLDEKGHVVGINLGGGEIGDKTFGIANPADSIRALVVASGIGDK